VIAATNTDLKSAVESGRFRNDLYWRLNVVTIVLPSLRERREDINLIIDHFVDQFNRELGLSVRTVSADARQLLTLHTWPGNVRELENAVCSAMIMCEGNAIRVKDLPPRIRGESDVTLGSTGCRLDVGKQPLLEVVREATEKLERMMIVSRLAEMMGNRTATAESLGISRKSLFNKMRQYGLGDEESDDGH
jgi:DNA-binding NtrC family response regulator